MRLIKGFIFIGLCLSIAACDEGKVDPVLKAPDRNPMELDPNPPMSANDIDSIVREKTRGKGGATSSTENSEQSATSQLEE